MTKREMFETIATINADNEEIVAFCNHEIELLANRKSGSKGMTKTQKENELIKATIVDVLSAITEPCTVSELLADARLNSFTNQKISALLRQLVISGAVVKKTEGKKTRFVLS